MNEKEQKAETEEALAPEDLAETIAADAADTQSQEEAQNQALDAEKERYLRLAAEYDNYRKRSQKEREALQASLRVDIASKFLSVYDNLARAISTETEDEAFLKGVEMTMAGLWEVFESLGISKIPALGETFDPERHNAVFHIEDAQYGEGEIIEELLTGFLLGDKVIRHSVVKVAN